MILLHTQCITGFLLAINKATVPERRGELNGLASTVGSVAMMVGPAVWSSLFAFSVEGNRPFPFDFHLTFFAIATLRLVVAILSWNMSEVEVHDRNVVGDEERRHPDDERDCCCRNTGRV